MSNKVEYSLITYTDMSSNDDLLIQLCEDAAISKGEREFNPWLHNRKANDRSRIKITITVEDAAFDS